MAVEPRADRLGPLDLSNLRVETHGLPMHVAALALVDGAGLLDASGEPLLDEVRRHVEPRTRRAPRLRQVLTRPGQGPPSWVDDDGFDIARHVRARRVPEPGDEAALLAVCCELNEPPLDRDRPLWELWLLSGLDGDRVALLIRLHHVVADGVAALALLGSLFDTGPDTGPDAGSTVPSAPGTRGGRVRAWPAQAAAMVRRGRAPAVSFNRPVGPHRRLVLLRADLEAARAVAHGHGGKVNDVLLAAMAGGARRLLESRGELRPGLVLEVSVAASVRRADERGGNRVGVRVVPVPVDEPDALARLETIARSTAAQRARPPYQPNGRLLQRWMVHVMFRQRLVNLLLSNVPGPTRPLALAGAPVRELFQVGTVQGNLALAVGALSYAGRLNLTVVADAEVVPDAAVFAAGIDEALAQLGVRPGGRPGRPEGVDGGGGRESNPPDPDAGPLRF